MNTNAEKNINTDSIINFNVRRENEDLLNCEDLSLCFDITDDEKIEIAARRILQKFKPAFEKLAKG